MPSPPSAEAAPPELVDEAVRRDRLPAGEQEQREHAARFRATERDRIPVDRDLERSEQPKVPFSSQKSRR